MQLLRSAHAVLAAALAAPNKSVKDEGEVSEDSATPPRMSLADGAGGAAGGAAEAFASRCWSTKGPFFTERAIVFS